MHDIVLLVRQFGADALLWASMIFYSFCLLPQVVENARLQSTHGLSDHFILLYFNGCNTMLFYVYWGNLALAYKVMLPVECFLVAVMVGQRLYYGSRDARSWFKQALAASLVITSFGLLPVLMWPQETSLMAGWLATALFTVNQIPQVIKLFRERSTEGFSFGFASMLAFAQLCELTGGLLKRMPLPTIVMAARGLVVYTIYCFQFARYRKR